MVCFASWRRPLVWKDRLHVSYDPHSWQSCIWRGGQLVMYFEYWTWFPAIRVVMCLVSALPCRRRYTFPRHVWLCNFRSRSICCQCIFSHKKCTTPRTCVNKCKNQGPVTKALLVGIHVGTIHTTKVYTTTTQLLQKSHRNNRSCT